MINEIKIELTEKSKIDTYGITKLFQIRAKVDIKNKFGLIPKGTIGGWVESLKLKNGDARVSGNARVSGRINLKISCNFEISRITIDTKKKLQKLKSFLDNF